MGSIKYKVCSNIYCSWFIDQGWQQDDKCVECGEDTVKGTEKLEKLANAIKAELLEIKTKK